MSAQIIGLVILAAVFHAVWNALAKRAEGFGALFVWGYQVVGAVALAVPSLLLLSADPSSLGPLLLLAAIVTGFLHVGYATSLQTGYAKGDLSTVYPVARGTGPLLTVIVAVLVLGDHPGALALSGALIIVAGILVVTLRTSHSPPDRRRAGFLWGLLTGVFIASYTLWDDHAVNELSAHPVVYFWLSCVVQVILLAPVAIRRRDELPDLATRHWGTTLAVGLLSPAAYVLILFAMQHAPVALVAPMRESSIVIGLLQARILFGEKSIGLRMAGSVIVIAGIALIALA